MPRKAKGPRLYLRNDRTGGRSWVILDGKIERRTGSSEDGIAGAERALARYIASKYTPPTRGTIQLDKILIADVINIYLRERAPYVKNESFISATTDPILTWWGGKTLADIRGRTCREYVTWRTKQRIKRRKTAQRVSTSTARHDLKTLRAAVRYYHGEYGPLPSEPKITLPEATPARDRWLTKAEAARFVMAAHRADYDYLVRFLLIGLHTATRSGAILLLQWKRNALGGWIDVERGLIYRRGSGETETKKRRPPARIPDKLLPWLRRWRAKDAEAKQPYVINFQGNRIKKLRRSWATVRKTAKLGSDVTPHTLRHTAVCWQLQAGVPVWEVAGWAGMTVDMVDEVYGHHHPDHQKNIGKRR